MDTQKRRYITIIRCWPSSYHFVRFDCLVLNELHAQHVKCQYQRADQIEVEIRRNNDLTNLPRSGKDLNFKSEHISKYQLAIIMYTDMSDFYLRAHKAQLHKNLHSRRSLLHFRRPRCFECMYYNKVVKVQKN